MFLPQRKINTKETETNVLYRFKSMNQLTRMVLHHRTFVRHLHISQSSYHMDSRSVYAIAQHTLRVWWWYICRCIRTLPFQWVAHLDRPNERFRTINGQEMRWKPIWELPLSVTQRERKNKEFNTWNRIVFGVRQNTHTQNKKHTVPSDYSLARNGECYALQNL